MRYKSNQKNKVKNGEQEEEKTSDEDKLEKKN